MFESTASKEQIDWEEVYEVIGDGSVDECLGAEWSHSCCGLKPVFDLKENYLFSKRGFWEQENINIKMACILENLKILALEFLFRILRQAKNLHSLMQ